MASAVAAAGLAVALALLAISSGADGFGFEFHHRFSDRVRQWAAERAVPGTRWPERGTVEYYTTLVHHDRALLGRSLADAGSGAELAFAGGNATVRLSSLGYLHYAAVELGTPNVSFLVALDTGSDLFWVPCDCQQCAPTSSIDYGANFAFNIYSPSKSSTSQKVTCSNSLCDHSNACPAANSTCGYTIQYLSSNTSSSGTLVEDILYLKKEDATHTVVEAPIVFGCGQVQTGSFLTSAAPNGLFGLARDKTSVPSILSSKGFTSNSFSMCFGNDGVGRINFGDKGTSDQQETPFTSGVQSLYGVQVTSVVVGSDTFGVSVKALVDSGTSFTILSDPLYTNISESFNKQVQETRHGPISGLPFQYCYDISPTQQFLQLPEINLTMSGGGIFPVNDPIIVANLQGGQFIYCLAIIKSRGIDIIGQNFMTGLRVVFDREREILGWRNFDCYKTGNTSDLAVNNSTPPAASPGSFTPSETSNTTQVPVTRPTSSTSTGYSPHSNPITSLSLLLLMLYLAII